MDFNQAEDVILVIGIHKGEVRALGSTLTQHGILNCDRFMMPLLVTLPSDVQRRLHAPLASVVIQLPSRACRPVIPDDGHRHDLRFITFGEALVQLEKHRVFAGGVLKGARKAGVNGRHLRDRPPHAPERNRRSVGIDLIKKATVVVWPDIPAHVVQSRLRVSLPDLPEQ